MKYYLEGFPEPQILLFDLDKNSIAKTFRGLCKCNSSTRITPRPSNLMSKQPLNPGPVPLGSRSIDMQEWVSFHLTGGPDIAREAERLASMMTGDARSHGISGAVIFRAIGNIDDYLTSELEKGSELLD